ncbi:MAG: hypothetical protein JKY96_07325 [Phycisphaerales bacterium]|nr:hypothetical protein [Phycisphaerales bacterium]
MITYKSELNYSATKRPLFGRGQSWSVCFLLASTVLLMGGCTTLNSPEGSVLSSAKLQDSSLKNKVVRAPKPTRSTYIDNSDVGPTIVQTPSELGYVPSLLDPNDTGDVQTFSKRPRLKAKKVDAFVAPLILPEFIDVVFGEMLKTPYVTGPKVANLTTVVQLRSSGEMKATDFLALVSTALEEYGVRVVVEGGAYRILDDGALRARMPKFIKGRARLRTRSDLRPVIQFVELQAVGVNSMLELLQRAFGRQNDKLNITADLKTNHIILSGLPEDVENALVIIRQLDELRYAGTKIRRYTPRYWDVNELTTELSRALTVEGWQVSAGDYDKRTIYLMPVDYSNDLFVFTNSSEAHRRVDSWLKEFDRPINGGDTEQIYIYQVKNVDATELVETANDVLSGASGTRPSQTPANQTLAQSRAIIVPGQRDANSGASTQVGLSARTGSGGNRFTVDTMGNRIIFTGTVADYDSMVGLLRQLDTPVPEVLIEVQIAEVTLADNTNFGMQFSLMI